MQSPIFFNIISPTQIHYDEQDTMTQILKNLHDWDLKLQVKNPCFSPVEPLFLQYISENKMILKFLFSNKFNLRPLLIWGAFQLRTRNTLCWTKIKQKHIFASTCVLKMLLNKQVFVAKNGACSYIASPVHSELCTVVSVLDWMWLLFHSRIVGLVGQWAVITATSIITVSQCDRSTMSQNEMSTVRFKQLFIFVSSLRSCLLKVTGIMVDCHRLSPKAVALIDAESDS